MQPALAHAELATWILSLFGIPSLMGVWFAFRYKQPIAMTGTFLAIVLVASIGAQFSYQELIGAFMVAGGLMVIVGILGLSNVIARWVPAPVVLAILAGAALPFVVSIFSPIGTETWMVGSALLTYVVGRRFLGTQAIILLPVILVGVVAAALTDQLGTVPDTVSVAPPTITIPSFSLQAIASIIPVLVVLMSVQANLPSSIILQRQGYDPPARLIDLASGAGTLFASFLGPVAVSVSMPLTSLTSGREAGEHSRRHWSMYVTGLAGLVLAMLAGVAAVVAGMLPLVLLLMLAGVAMIGIFISALQDMLKGPLYLGPVCAFAVAVSDISLFGFGPFFWALVFGIGISMLLEGTELKAMRTETSEPTRAPEPAPTPASE